MTSTQSDALPQESQLNEKILPPKKAKLDSKVFGEYFVVEPEHTLKLEQLGSDNSLFLAIARAFLFKIHFEDKLFELVLRNCLTLNDDNGCIEPIQFDSDVELQEIIRKRLCLHWMNSIQQKTFFK